MKEYLIPWCDDSGVYWCPITNSKSYFVGDCLQEIAKAEGLVVDNTSESGILCELQSHGLIIELFDISSNTVIGWDY